MALRVNSSSSSSIPDNIFRAMTGQNSKYPDKWKDEWLASLLDSQHNDDWELKLTSKDGIPQRRILSNKQQTSEAVCAGLLELRDFWNGRATA
jgi:hypothetical protein